MSERKLSEKTETIFKCHTYISVYSSLLEEIKIKVDFIESRWNIFRYQGRDMEKTMTHF